MDGIRLLQGYSVRSAAEVNLCRCERDRIVLRYDPLLSRCFTTINFTRLVIGDVNDATEVLQLINHNDMVDLITEKQQTISFGIICEYNGKDYFATDVVNNVVTVESQDCEHTITVHTSLCTIIN